MRRARKHLVFSFLLAVAWPLGAQQPEAGVVAGRVGDRATRASVAGATVVLVGTVQSVRTSDDGRYRLVGVRPGNHTVRVTRLGYAAETRPVTVVAGQEAVLDIEMGQTAVRIDEIVVTATGETQRKRESGNVVSTIAVSPERLATTTTLAQLLTASAPGVYVNSPGGTTGSASRIRIRGANSVSLSNEPLLLIDGVRANNDIQGGASSGAIGVGGQVSSRLNDINPDDIASIEVIKGPAASALYGTAAANGVLQIRTKRGRAGATRWTVHSEAGSQSDETKYPANFAQIGTQISNGARTTGCTLDAQTRLVCTPKPDSLVSFNPLMDASPFITGYRTSQGVSVAGGGDLATYFLSGDIAQDHGVVAPNTFRRVGLRGNLTSQFRSNVTNQVSTSYASSRLKFPQNDNNILGVISGGLLGTAFNDSIGHGYLSGQTPQEIFAFDTRENVERFIGSNQTTWQALPWLTGTLQAGVDFLDKRNKETLPPNKVFFNSSTAEGSRTANAGQFWTYTGNGSLTAVRDLRSDIRSSTTAGVQYSRDVVQVTRASGAKLLAGTGSLSGTSTRFAVAETNTDNRTVGALVSEQVAWRDRLFGTVAMRTDNNSAFGSKFGWVNYPAASLSWVISEEGFFPRTDYITSLRLRTAYGKSGQRPNFRDAITFFSTQTVTSGSADIPGVLVGGTGNAELKPEVSGEFEVGFEVGLLNNRVSVDATLYDKRTNDLLIARPLPPSLGLTTTQFSNLGSSSNKGIEVQVNSRVLEMNDVLLELGITGSTNRNRLLSLGKLPNGDLIPPIVFGRQRHVEGYPLGGYWDRSYTYEDKNGDGIISRLNCPGQTTQPGGPECEILLQPLTYLGNPLPTRDLGFLPRLTLFKTVEISSIIDYRGGFKLYNNTARFRCNFLNCVEAYDKTKPLDKQAANIAHLLGTDAGYVEDAHYTKLREIAVSYLVPREWATRVRANDMRLTLAGRNLKTWTKYTGFDPEVNSTPGTLFSTSDFLTQPPLRVFSARLTLGF
jgi:TonB-linked SusC/RagA family outer membrane protein